MKQLRRASYILRRHGWRELAARARRKLRPAPVFQPGWGQTYSAEALRYATYLDYTPADLARSQAATAAHPGALDLRTITWFLPHFEHAYYGGVYTILRFAAGFARRSGVRHTFAIVGPGAAADAAAYQTRIAAAFPELAGAAIAFVPSDAAIGALALADAAVATAWDTAYTVLKFNQVRRKFYFLQDFEPMFYPAGSTSAQAESTYRFGFCGLTNTVALQQHYQHDYGGQATFFNPCVDTALFYPPATRDWAREPYTVFFYARPRYWRNGFELGAAALRLLKQQLGRRVRIVSAGQAWQPADYGLDGVVENLGLLPYAGTAELYRSCDAGLAMMFTRHPSYLPLEFMASGCLVVSNINNATSWLLRDGENCLLAMPSASCIAEALARGLADTALRQRITASAHALIQRDFADWERPIAQVYAYMCDPSQVVQP